MTRVINKQEEHTMVSLKAVDIYYHCLAILDVGVFPFRGTAYFHKFHLFPQPVAT